MVNWDALRTLFTKPFTGKYPFAKKEAFPHFRGNIIYHSKKCIGCKLCEKYCPVNAIKVREKGKIDFDMGLCIYCGNCHDVCPTKAIEYSNKFEFAQGKKKDLSNITD